MGNFPARLRLKDSVPENIKFYGIHLDAFFLQPLHGVFDGFSLAGEFEGDDPDLLGDTGVADIEDQLEFFAHLPDQRPAGELGGEGEPVASGFFGGGVAAHGFSWGL